MTVVGEQSRKRAVNLTLNEGLVAQAKTYTKNLSATIEALLAEFVISQQKASLTRQKAADVCAAGWNDLQDSIGSFADQHSPL